MATTRSKKQVSMADEDAAFFRNAYKNDPKARAAMDKEGYKPTADKAVGSDRALIMPHERW